MSENNSISAGNADRSVRLLIGLLIGARWALCFMLVAVPLAAARAPFFPLRIGGGEDEDAMNVHLGAAFDESMSQAAINAHAVAAVIAVVFGIYATGQMLGVMRNVRRGDSFVRDNGERLRRIGYAGIVAQLSVYAVWIAALVIGAAGLAALEGLRIELNIAPWIGILMAFALATVFRDGADLKEEQDLTV